MPDGDLHSHLFEAPFDESIGVYSRSTILSMLFRETDRAQRMKTALCLVQFQVSVPDTSDGRPNSKPSDESVHRAIKLMKHQLRSYDLIGSLGRDEFLAILPGCRLEDAALLAERLRVNVFSKPFVPANEGMQFSACFGIASSEGRSAIMVLREVSQALRRARETGPGTIFCFGSDINPLQDSFDLSNPEEPAIQ
jgi:two-component system, cell cycle response regulator